MIERIRNITSFRQDCIQGLNISFRTSFITISPFCPPPDPQFPLEGPPLFGAAMARIDTDLMTSSPAILEKSEDLLP